MAQIEMVYRRYRPRNMSMVDLRARVDSILRALSASTDIDSGGLLDSQRAIAAASASRPRVEDSALIAQAEEHKNHHQEPRNSPDQKHHAPPEYWHQQEGHHAAIADAKVQPKTLVDTNRPR